MPPPSADIAALSRQLRTLWGAVLAGGALVLAIMGWLAVTGDPSAPELAQPAFFGVAVLSLGGLVAALALMRTLEDAEARSPVEVQQRALFAIAALDATVVLAGVAAVLTGEVLALAFGVPLFGFAAIFWPTEARVARWLGEE